LRESETKLLKLEGFELDRRILHIRRRVYRNAVGETKRPASKRDIPYAKAVALALENYLAAGCGGGKNLF